MRIFLIGAGERALTIIKNLKETNSDIGVSVLYDPDISTERLEKESALSGLVPIDNVERADPGQFDLVMIGSPTCFHLEQLKTCRQFKKPIFCEKPAVLDFDESMELARLDGSGAFPHGLYFGFVLRHAELFQFTDTLLQNDPVVTLEANEYLHPEHGAYIARNWRRKAELGGTYLLDKAVHDFDLFNQLIGSRPAVISSFARQAHFGPSNASKGTKFEGQYQFVPSGWRGVDSPFDESNQIMDAQVVIAEYENGALLTFNTNTHTGLRQRRMFLGTRNQAVELDFQRNHIAWRAHYDTNNPETRKFDGDFSNHYGSDPRQAAKILDFANTGKSAISVRQAIEAGLTVMLADKAAETRQIVDCRPVWKALDDCYVSQ